MESMTEGGNWIKIQNVEPLEDWPFVEEVCRHGRVVII